MAKLTAWLVTLLGVLLVLDVLDVLDVTTLTVTNFWGWILALAVLVIGIGKLQRNYQGKKRR